MNDERSTVLAALAALRALPALTPATVGAAFGHALALADETPHLLVHEARPDGGPYAKVALLTPAPGARHNNLRAVADLRPDVDVTRDDVEGLLGEGAFCSVVPDAPGGRETRRYPAGMHALYLTYSVLGRRLRSVCIAREG